MINFSFRSFLKIQGHAGPGVTTILIWSSELKIRLTSSTQQVLPKRPCKKACEVLLILSLAPAMFGSTKSADTGTHLTVQYRTVRLCGICFTATTLGLRYTTLPYIHHSARVEIYKQNRSKDGKNIHNRDNHGLHNIVCRRWSRICGSMHE